MRGVGHASSAITFLNALATGIGSAAGIGLPTTATVELEPVHGPLELAPDRSCDSALVRGVLRASLARWGPGRAFRVRAAVDSEIPIARGLKSSSSVSGAVARAVADALGVYVPSTEVARLSADVSQEIGLSATGAFDDALAALEPGVHVTDNGRRLWLRTDAVDPTWQVVLWIPNEPHLPSPTYREAFQRLRAEAGPAEAAARRGDPLAAMSANSEIVERAVGYSYATMRRQLAEAGALASSVSGMGPALAAVVTDESVSSTLRALPPGAGDVIVTRFTSRPAGSPWEAR